MHRKCTDGWLSHDLRKEVGVSLHADDFRARKHCNEEAGRNIVTRSTQRDPDPKDSSLKRKEASTRKGLHSTFAASSSYKGVVVRVRVPLFCYS